jgi:hypothetical protein
MPLPRWAAQDAYDAAIQLSVSRYGGGVTVPMVKAIIATESGFNPQAYRTESPRASLPPTPDFPDGGDASFGLMQLLSRTARGLGFRGTLDGLFNPTTNIDLGVKLMADNLRRSFGVVADSVSAYNGGFRPTMGYGTPLGGAYANQTYVNSVLQNLDYFREWEAAKGGPSAPVADTFPVDRSGGPVVAGDAPKAVDPEEPTDALRIGVRNAVLLGLAVWAVIVLSCSYFGG